MHKTLTNTDDSSLKMHKLVVPYCHVKPHKGRYQTNKTFLHTISPNADALHQLVIVFKFDIAHSPILGVNKPN